MCGQKPRRKKVCILNVEILGERRSLHCRVDRVQGLISAPLLDLESSRTDARVTTVTNRATLAPPPKITAIGVPNPGVLLSFSMKRRPPRSTLFPYTAPYT